VEVVNHTFPGCSRGVYTQFVEPESLAFKE
jgi:hypothetical protein